MIRFISFLIFIAAVVACNSDKKPTVRLPKATGKPGDILLFMDSVQWNGALEDEIRNIFLADMPGLPQQEPMFKLIWVHPINGKTMLTRLRNLVYVFTLDQQTSGSKVLRRNFSAETLAQIKNDSSFYLSTKTDEYSKGQHVMYLFGNTQEDLIRHLKKYKQSIIDYFNVVEKNRLHDDLLKTGSTKGISAFLRNEQQCEIHVPIGYQLADKRDDFVWFRDITTTTDEDIFISWKQYTDQSQFSKDSLVAWRDEIARKYLYEDPSNPISYLVTEQKHAEVLARPMKLNGHYTVELRGLWHTNNHTMGGPFLSYTLIDEPRGLLYYIEGFTYAPGKDKREIMRQLEITLSTFKMSDEIKVSTK